MRCHVCSSSPHPDCTGMAPPGLQSMALIRSMSSLEVEIGSCGRCSSPSQLQASLWLGVYYYNLTQPDNSGSCSAEIGGRASLGELSWVSTLVRIRSYQTGRTVTQGNEPPPPPLSPFSPHSVLSGSVTWMVVPFPCCDDRCRGPTLPG